MDEKTKNMPVAIDDGLDAISDDDASGIIKGTKLKFTNDGEWETGDGVAIAADRELIVVEIVKAVQKWIDQLPVETCVLAADEKFPDIDELNAEAPREEWCEKFGREVGPWQKCYVVYLLDPETVQIFTFPTSTDGGSRAIRELREATRLARRIRGANIYPRVRLADAHMNTRYGARQRPHFNIIHYETLGGSERATLTAAEPKLIEVKPNSERTAPASNKCSARLDPDFDGPPPC
jgi:hypothetical protein